MSGKRVAIVQSNYIPWKGYFDLIASVDEFILYDDVQFTRRDWRNRNRIKTPQGVHWLTVPVKVKGRFLQSIRETEIDGDAWAAHHWQVLAQNYRKASCFKQMAAVFEPLFLEGRYTHLSVLNRALIEAVCGVLGIETRISDSSSYRLIEGRSERLAELCLQAGGGRICFGAFRPLLSGGFSVCRARLAVQFFRIRALSRVPTAVGRVRSRGEYSGFVVQLRPGCAPLHAAERFARNVGEKPVFREIR